jgi:hypothetical protein
MKSMLAALACAAALAAVPFATAAADTPILRVVVVQPTDTAAYVKEVTALRGMFKQLGIPATLRVWHATYAGPETGTIVVALEFPNMQAVASYSQTLRASPEATAQLAKVTALRMLISDSLYEELTK